MNIVSDILGSLDVRSLPFFPGLHQVRREARLFPRAKWIRNNEFPYRNARCFAVITEDLPSESFRKPVRGKSLKRFLALAFVHFENGAGKQNAFATAVFKCVQDIAKIGR